MSYKVIILESGHAIRFTIKKCFGVHFLLIMTNFKPLAHPALVQINWLTVDGIKQMDSTGVYDDKTGYVIYTLNKGYNADNLFTEIENQFKNHFECQQQKQ